MAGFKQHRKHLAPQVGRRHGFAGLDLAALGLLLVSHVGFFESQAEQVVQVGHIGGGEQGPAAFFHDTAHEQVGDPVGRVHVVGAAAVIAGVLAQLQEFFDVQVPGFQIGADCALALAALVDRYRCVVDHLQERHHTLRFAVGAFDVGAQGTHGCPVVAQTACKFRQQGVFLDGVIDAAQIVGHGGQVAARELRAQGAAVEQGRRGRHEVERRQDLVELDGAGFAVDFIERQAHGHAHEESLGHFDAGFADVQEVTVVQRLQAQVVELQITFWLEGFSQLLQIELKELFIQQVVVHALFDELREVLDVGLAHLALGNFFAQNFLGDGVHQQTRGHIGVIRVFFDQGTRGQDGRFVNLFHGHAVVQVAHGFCHDGLGFHIFTEAGTGIDHERFEVIKVQGHALAAVDHMQAGGAGLRGGLLSVLCALLGAALTVKHISASDFVVAAAHQTQLDLVLHIFNVESTAART